MCKRFSKPEKYIKERLSVTIPRLLNHATTTLQTWFINFVLQIVWHIYVRRARVQVSLLFVHQFFFNNFAFSRTEYKCKVEPFDLGVSFPMRETVRKHLKQYSRRIFLITFPLVKNYQPQKTCILHGRKSVTAQYNVYI